MEDTELIQWVSLSISIVVLMYTYYVYTETKKNGEKMKKDKEAEDIISKLEEKDKEYFWDVEL